MSLSNPQNAAIAKAAGLGTIRNDDPFPELSIDDGRVTEGDSGTKAAVFVLDLSFPLDRPVTVTYATAEGTALAGVDYLPQTNTVTFPAGSTAQTIAIPIVGDVLDEPDEGFYIVLSNPTWATIKAGRALETIVDNDAAPLLSVKDLVVNEGDGGTADAVFTMQLSPASGQTVAVSYSTADGTATAGTDYTARFGTVTFAPGVTAVQVTVAVRGDTTFEPDESFLLKLSNPINARVDGAEPRCMIRNDDPAPVISIGDVGVSETAGGTVASFVVTLSIPSLEAFATVNYATADGTATDGADYEGGSGLVTFAPGATRATIEVPILDDPLPEADETFLVNLTGPANGELANAQARGIIRDNDGAPKMFLRDSQKAEGDAGTSELIFSIELDQPSGSPVSATFAARDGTATAASGDYTAASGQVRFEPGRTNATVTIAIHGDAIVEPDETLVVDLTDVVNAIEGRVHAIGTILDDDARKLSISDAAVEEGASGSSTNAVFTVRLNKPAADPVTVNYATSDGTAEAGGDYVATSGVLTFAPGVTIREVSVTVLGDDVFEPDETFQVNLRAPINAALADNLGIGTILNDDDSVAIVADGMTLESEDCTPNNGVIDPGETVTVRLGLRNIGTLTSGNVVARLLTSPGITPINTAQTYGVLPPNSASVSRPFAFKANGECGQSIQAIVQIENGGTNYGTAAFPFRLGAEVDGVVVCCQSADVAVTVSGVPQTSVINHDLGYTIQVTNRGPAAATQLMMTNTWRALVAVRSAQASQGACAIQGETVLCDLGELEPGATATVEIVVRPQQIGPLIGVFYARAVEHEPNPVNNSAAVPTVIDPPPGLSIGNCRVQEDGKGGSNAVFTVLLSPPTGREVTVAYATADGSARAGEDYAAASGTAIIPGGATSTTISIPIVNDVRIEPDETFTVTLSKPVFADLAAEQTTGTATIVDDDVPGLTVSDASIPEPESGTTAKLAFILQLSAAPQRPVTVNFTTSDGTAGAPLDYAQARGIATFDPGATLARVEVDIVGDSIAEREETFLVNLSNAVGARIEKAQAKGTIVDNAFLPELSVRDVSVSEGPSQANTSAAFELRLSRPSTQAVEVEYATANGSGAGRKRLCHCGR